MSNQYSIGVGELATLEVPRLIAIIANLEDRIAEAN